MMNTEIMVVLLSFATAALTLTGMILASLRGMRIEMRKRFDGLEVRMDRLEGRMDKLESRLAGLEQGQAKSEGKLEGLLEAFALSRGAA